jgi:hypothetical protein
MERTCVRPPQVVRLPFSVPLSRQKGATPTRALISLKEYRKRNDSGAVYDDPRVAVGAGCFDEVGARAEAESKYKAIRHGVTH